MARVRMITRTVVNANYDVLVMNMKTMQGEKISVSVPSGDTMTDKQRQEIITSSIPDNMVFVQILGVTFTETLYGMPEDEFIRLAKVLPPRTSEKE